MRNVSQGLERDLGAVKGAAAGGAAGLKLLRTTLLALGLGLVGILGAGGFVEDLLDGCGYRTHSSLLLRVLA